MVEEGEVSELHCDPGKDWRVVVVEPRECSRCLRTFFEFRKKTNTSPLTFTKLKYTTVNPLTFTATAVEPIHIVVSCYCPVLALTWGCAETEIVIIIISIDIIVIVITITITIIISTWCGEVKEG